MTMKENERRISFLEKRFLRIEALVWIIAGMNGIKFGGDIVNFLGGILW
jgi:hypothetical protein